MNEMRTDPRGDPELKDLVQKALWIVKTFGLRSWRRLRFRGSLRTGIFPIRIRNRYEFAWGNVRISAFHPMVIPEAGKVESLQENDPSLIISLRRERKTRLLGFVPIRLHRFQEIFVSDFSAEVKRLKIPAGADLAKLQAAIGALHNALRKVLVGKAMTAEQIRRLPRGTLAKMLEEDSGRRST